MLCIHEHNVHVHTGTYKNEQGIQGAQAIYDLLCFVQHHDRQSAYLSMALLLRSKHDSMGNVVKVAASTVAI
eukprot:m.229647 g.229647  ORF g.229647 m.229647 type:complete len:72 (+) comp15213_c1_seq27:764-979(+)